jgi:magnesium transporter
MLAMGFENAKSLSSEAIYAFLGRGWLVTVRAAHNDSIEEARMLFRQNDRRMMAASLDSIYYSIVTGIVNSYEQLLTSIELSIASLGQDSLHKPSRRMLEKLDILSKHIITLRRHFWRTRHIINLLINTKEENREEGRQLKVAYDEINQLIDLVESLRDSINSTQNLYLANASLHLNDTMRTLTIFSAILLPLTFMAGLYGMNGIDLNDISNIPAGFALVLAAMAAVTAAMFIFFRQKKWIFVQQEYGDDDRNDKGHHPANKQDKENGHI